LSLRGRRVEGEGQAPPLVGEVLRSPGRSLPPPVRDFFTSRFGHDFSRVRIHADAQAAESARAVNALAYTVGRDVVFASGQYDPTSVAGRWLLSHELTHTIQQRQQEISSANGSLPDGPERYERQARAAAVAVQLGTRFPAIEKGAALSVM